VDPLLEEADLVAHALRRVRRTWRVSPRQHLRAARRPTARVRSASASSPLRRPTARAERQCQQPTSACALHGPPAGSPHRAPAQAPHLDSHCGVLQLRGHPGALGQSGRGLLRVGRARASQPADVLPQLRGPGAQAGRRGSARNTRVAAACCTWAARQRRNAPAGRTWATHSAWPRSRPLTRSTKTGFSASMALRHSSSKSSSLRGRLRPRGCSGATLAAAGPARAGLAARAAAAGSSRAVRSCVGGWAPPSSWRGCPACSTRRAPGPGPGKECELGAGPAGRLPEDNTLRGEGPCDSAAAAPDDDRRRSASPSADDACEDGPGPAPPPSLGSAAAAEAAVGPGRAASLAEGGRCAGCRVGPSSGPGVAGEAGPGPEPPP
jgi:hypothetical protein